MNIPDLETYVFFDKKKGSFTLHRKDLIAQIGQLTQIENLTTKMMRNIDLHCYDNYDEQFIIWKEKVYEWRVNCPRKLFVYRYKSNKQFEFMTVEKYLTMYLDLMEDNGELFPGIHAFKSDGSVVDVELSVKLKDN